jgi:uncharacterized membrane protein
MALNFHNNHNNTIWLAFNYGDKGCGPHHFRKQGWWGINPGQTLNLWNVHLYDVNRFASFYAEAGGATWSGNLNYRVTNNKFNQCFDDDTNCDRLVPFFGLDFQNADNGNSHFESMMITLGPAAGQIKRIGSVIIDEG